MKLQDIPKDLLFRLQCDGRFRHKILGLDHGEFVCTAVEGPFEGVNVFLPGMIDVEPVEYLQ